ncbi:MAG: hypothetical protein ACI4DV_05835 [Lachnospiraceae bacterium]
MLDRNHFTETLRSVAEIRRTSAEPLSREEILGFFEGMELTEEQQDMIYEYMQLSPEEQTEEAVSQEEETEVLPEEDEEDNVYFRMYLEDLRGVSELSGEQLREAYQRLLDGDAAVIEKISESWLRRIVEMAKPHAAFGASLADVIQEGNMGLFLKLSELAGAGAGIDVNTELEEAIEAAMTAYVEETTGEDNSENTVVAKVTLLHEAQKALAEELGRTPETKELADYTRIAETEIADILAMTKENK